MTLDVDLGVDLLLDNVSDAIIAMSRDTRILKANDRAALLYRRPRAELTGQQLVALFPGLNQTPSFEQLTRALSASIPTRFELFLPNLFSWHSVLAVPQPWGALLFVRDISDRVRREKDEAVRASVRRIVEDLPVCVTITRGPNHRIELANRLARALVNGREVEGELLETVLPEARGQGFISLLDGVLASGVAYRGDELPLVWKPDEQAGERQGIFNLVYQPLYGASGEIDGVLHLGVEITEQIQRRQTIARYAAERSAILEQLTEGVIVTDEAGRITFVNAAATRLHGVAVLDVTPDEYSDSYDLLTEAGEPHPFEDLPLTQAVRFNRTVKGARWKIRRPDGSVVLVTGNATPVLGADGSRLACVLTMSETTPLT